jgi:hypothetical protein
MTGRQQDAIDLLWDIAIAHALVPTLGEDRIEAIVAEALAGTELIPLYAPETFAMKHKNPPFVMVTNQVLDLTCVALHVARCPQPLHRTQAAITAQTFTAGSGLAPPRHKNRLFHRTTCTSTENLARASVLAALDIRPVVFQVRRYGERLC